MVSTAAIQHRSLVHAAISVAIVHSTSMLGLGLLLAHHVDDLIGNAQVLDVDAADVHFGHPPEAVAVLAGANYLAQLNVHPVVALNEVAIVRLAILQLHQHWVILGGAKQCQWKHLLAVLILVRLG